MNINVQKAYTIGTSPQARAETPAWAAAKPARTRTGVWRSHHDRSAARAPGPDCVFGAYARAAGTPSGRRRRGILDTAASAQPPRGAGPGQQRRERRRRRARAAPARPPTRARESGRHGVPAGPRLRVRIVDSAAARAGTARGAGPARRAGGGKPRAAPPGSASHRAPEPGGRTVPARPRGRVAPTARSARPPARRRLRWQPSLRVLAAASRTTSERRELRPFQVAAIPRLDEVIACNT